MAEDPAPATSPARTRHKWLLLATVILAPLFALRGVFSTQRLFFLRDLSLYFWPHHLWLRRALAADQSPLWDPNPGLGYAAAADPAVQVFFLPTLPLRLLLPAVVGFNVSVALPFPLAGLGLFLFLRRHVAAAAACLGALVYALSGPVLSAGNCTNLAWCAALAPWALLATDRLVDRRSAARVALLAIVLACSFLAGEPVAFAATVALAGAYALFAVDRPVAFRDRVRRGVAVLLASAAALGFAAVQILPLISVAARSIRGAGWLIDEWRVHPLRLFELVMPDVFGNYLGTPAQVGPWLAAVNGGREPYLFSIYVGAGALLLAALAMFHGVRRGQVLFWLTAGLLAFFWALGDATPLYPALRALVPPLATLRYPVKLAIFATLAMACLAAFGADVLAAERPDKRPARWAIGIGTTSLGPVAIALLAVQQQWLSTPASELATVLGLAQPMACAQYLLASLSGGLVRLLTYLLGCLLCLWVGASGLRIAAVGRVGLPVLIVLDLLGNGARLNPTLPASLFAEPAWVQATRAHAEDRVFITQDFLATRGDDPDLPPPPALSAQVPLVAALAVHAAQLPPFPSAWGVREAVAQELTGLRPREYLGLLGRYTASDRDARTRALRRLGVRYHVLPRPPSPEALPLMELPGLAPLTLYEDTGTYPHVLVAGDARVCADAEQALAALFASDFDARNQVIVDTDAPTAGRAAPATETRASITDASHTRVSIDASLAKPGYVVLFDAYDPDWRVTVDGRPASLLRADGLVRAVHVAEGTHALVFTYRPRAFCVGAGVSLATAIALLVALLHRRRDLTQGARVTLRRRL